MKLKDSLLDARAVGLKENYRVEDILFLTQLNEELINVDTEEIFDELTTLISRYISVTHMRVYHFNLPRKTFRLKIAIGERAGLENSFFLESKPLLAHAIFHSQAVRSPEDTSTLYIFLKVNNIPIAFIDIKVDAKSGASPETINLLEGLINFTGKTLERNTPVSKLHSFYPKKYYMSRSDFEKRVDIERRRKKSFGVEFSILKYHLTNKDFDYYRDEILKTVRETDYFAYDYREETLLFLFPCTPEELIPSIKKHLSSYLMGYNVEAI